MSSNLPKNINANFIENAPLSSFTTFQLGGPCKGLFECRTPDELESVIKTLHDNRSQYILIGGGSNIVVSDQGLDCYVVRYLTSQPLIEYNKTDVYVTASTILDQLALSAAEQGLEGLNCTTGIPGTVGGAIVGNAGAFGRQIGDVIKSVVLMDRSGHTREALSSDLEFAYRHSALKETDDIVVSAILSLKIGDRESLLREREETLSLRAAKHPDLALEPCAGSFFRNIEPTSKAGRRQAAGWFLEQSGGKDLNFGGAQIYNKHANIIVKGNDCMAEDVLQLSKLMYQAVKKKFSIDMVREVRFIGDFRGKSKDVTDLIW